MRRNDLAPALTFARLRDKILPGATQTTAMQGIRMPFTPQTPRPTRPVWRLTALIIALAAALSLTTACGSVEVTEHRASITPNNALIAEVQVTLSAESRIFVEYENPEAGKYRTALSEPGINHTIPVVRLRPESVYTYTIGIQAGDGDVAYGPSGEFTTGPLPAELATLQTRISGRSTLPLIATDYRVDDYGYLVFYDETGGIVWYYVHKNVAGPYLGRNVNAIRQKPNGNLVYVSYECCLTEITPLGDMVDQIASGDDAGIPHHDFHILDDGRILYLSFANIVIDDSANGGNAETAVVVDELRIWDQQTGKIKKVWDSRDFWDVSDPSQRIVWDGDPWRWTHINSLSIGPRGNYIFNSRNRRQIFSLSPDFQTIEWQLGGPDSDYSFPNPGDRFYGQHSAAQLPNGNILVFDNGAQRPATEGGEYSRALELRLDHDSGAAVKAWEYRYHPDIYSWRISNAFRLDNGNTLVNFGEMQITGFMTLAFVEVDPQGNNVFRVETFQPGVGEHRPWRFRASGNIAAIMGETVLRPPAGSAADVGSAFSDWQLWPIRELEERLAGSPPVARGRFDLYLDANRLAYRKEPCAAGETADRFHLHIFPANLADLPQESRKPGFENLDFEFRDWGIIRDGKCLASAALPAYPIARIRTGQHTADGEQLWQAEFPIP